MAVITFPKIITDRLTDEGAKALADIFNIVEQSSQQTTLQIAEERFEKRLAQLDAKIDTVEARLERKIAESKAEMIKWMFIFWVGQAVTTFGMLYALLPRH